MKYKKADMANRFLAILIDYAIAWTVRAIIPILGGIAGAAYILLRDGLIYKINGDEDWKNKSIGKKLFNIEVVKLDGGYVDLETSVIRNIPLAIGNLIGIIPVLGWVVGPILALGFTIIELIIALGSANGRRLGDKWAGTMVVEESTIVIGAVRKDDKNTVDDENKNGG